MIKLKSNWSVLIVEYSIMKWFHAKYIRSIQCLLTNWFYEHLVHALQSIIPIEFVIVCTSRAITFNIAYIAFKLNTIETTM